MTIVVSHAMRRHSPPSPSGNYFVHRIGEDPSCQPPSPSSPHRPCDDRPLPRSMRVSDPWLYGSLRAAPPAGFFLTPALVLCTCPEYINGTKRSSKKGPVICKKCKGTRLPLHMVEPPPPPCAAAAMVNKYGTVRCYPAHPGPVPGGSVAIRAGTARVSSSSRPSILPTASDPYDFLRRSRSSIPDYNASLSKRPKSPSKSLRNDTFSMRHQGANRNKFGTAGRKSILECEINPYDLVGGTDDGDVKERSITFLNGQRIRVRPPLPEHDYEDVDNGEDNGKKGKEVEDHRVARRNSGSSKQTKIEPPSPPTPTTPPTSTIPTNKKQHQSLPPSQIPKPTDTYKSILKKTTFLDAEQSNRSLAHRRSSRSNFYLPKTVRKKVQFLDENEVVEHQDNNDYERLACDSDYKSSSSESATSSSEEIEEDAPKPPRVQRSVSERFDNQTSQVKFNDTMALRTKSRKKCASNNFSSVLVSSSIDISLIKSFSRNVPSRPPPPLPPPRIEEVEEEALPNETQDEKLEVEVPVKDGKLHAFEERVDSNDYDEVEKIEEEEEKYNVVEEAKEEIYSESENSKQEEMCIKSEEIKKDEMLITIEETKQEEDIKQEEYYKIGEDKEEQTVDDRDDLGEIFPPTAPPRKKNNKLSSLTIINESPLSERIARENFMEEKENNINSTSPQIIIKASGSPILSSPNKTIVQIRSIPETHKIQIKNDYPQVNFPQSMSFVGNGQRKTSIMINGDNCYSTVNVSDDTPIYLSSVVVTDTNTKIVQINTKNDHPEVPQIHENISHINQQTNTINVMPSPLIQNDESKVLVNHFEIISEDDKKYTNDISEEENQNKIIQEETEDKDNQERIKEGVEEADSKEGKLEKDEQVMIVPPEYQHEDLEEEERRLKEILRNPVEAVRLNLVPHVCGKADMVRRPLGRSTRCSGFFDFPDVNKPTERKFNCETFNCKPNKTTTSAEIGTNSRQDSSITSTDTGNSSMHYEAMELESDFYTDNSNRSSVAEDDSTIRSKFYELLAESAIAELSETDDHQYESIKNNADPIYEEIEVPPPLPTSPPPKNIIDDLQLDKQITTRSIFEGASKYDILSYLVDAKERGIVPEDNYVFGSTEVVIEEETIKESNVPFNRGSHMSTISDSSEDSSLIMPCTFSDEKTSYQKSAEVERNDSGVGSETSKASLTKYRNKPESSSNCEDCDTPVDVESENEALLCRRCIKRRSERKEIITEIVETEEKYSRDLQIILEEFYQPMLVAGLLTQDQLSAIFLNVEELLENSQALAERLRDAVEIAVEQGDEDLLTVNIGKLFLEATPMLHAFETYCVRQAGASLLLASLEKDKELLRIFLRVSQMENTMLRRMNLNSFLMVPVQRVTKYPLLLARLYKATPAQHETREQLMEAKHQIELHLNHMNSETKDVPSKLWRRIGSSSGRRLSTEMDLVSIKLRKIAVDVLEWNHEEAKFALEGKLFFTQPTDNNWRKGRTIKLTPVNALLVTNGKVSFGSRPEDDGLRFPRNSGIREAALLLVRDKNGRYSLLRDPLYLDRCVIATDPAWQSYFEVQEVIGKDTFIFKAEDEDMTQTWYRELQHHAQGLGIWRKRRNALANIMINGMGLRT